MPGNPLKKPQKRKFVVRREPRYRAHIATGIVALLGAGWPQIPAMAAVIAGLILVGILQGIVVAVGLNPVITTLAAGAIIFGVVSELTGGGIVRAGDNAASWGAGTIAGIPIEVLAFLAFTAIVTIVMARTVTGRETVLVGANRATAEISGISFTRVTTSFTSPNPRVL